MIADERTLQDAARRASLSGDYLENLARDVRESSDDRRFTVRVLAATRGVSGLRPPSALLQYRGRRYHLQPGPGLGTAGVEVRMVTK